MSSSQSGSASRAPQLNPFDNDYDLSLRRTEAGHRTDHVSNEEQKHSQENRSPHPSEARGNPSIKKVLNNVDDSLVKNGANSKIVAVDETDEKAVIRFLVSKRVFGYPNSNGSVISNYAFFVRNNHPLISIFLATKNHPYSMKKRLIVFVCIISFAIGLAYLVFNTKYVYQITVCREGCILTPSSKNSNLPGHCSGGFNDGLSQDTFKSICNYYQPWMISALCGAILVPYGSMLQFIAICGCFQGKDYFAKNSCANCVKNSFEFCGGGILSICLAVSCGIIVWAILDAYGTGSGYNFFLLFFISKLWSIGDWFIWTSLYFSFRYPMDKRYFYKSLEAASNKICRVESAH